jgi:hypothetical protein
MGATLKVSRKKFHYIFTIQFLIIKTCGFFSGAWGAAKGFGIGLGAGILGGAALATAGAVTGTRLCLVATTKLGTMSCYCVCFK